MTTRPRSDLVDKVIGDAGFRARLRANPEETLRGEGIEPTEEMLASLASFDWDSAERVGVAFLIT